MTTTQSTKMTDFLFMLGIAGAVLGAAADVLLLYIPGMDMLDRSYAFFTEIPYEGLIWGHFLGIFTIPLTLAGYRMVCHALEPMGGNVAWGVFGVVVLVFFAGVCYHSSLIFVAQALKDGQNIENLRVYFEPLGVVLIFGFAALSLTLMILILSLKTRYPRWVALFNPLFIYLFFAAAYFYLPQIGNILLIAGFNLANALFLFVSWIALRKKNLL